VGAMRARASSKLCTYGIAEALVIASTSSMFRLTRTPHYFACFFNEVERADRHFLAWMSDKYSLLPVGAAAVCSAVGSGWTCMCVRTRSAAWCWAGGARGGHALHSSHK
jgi:hypothetical protein